MLTVFSSRPVSWLITTSPPLWALRKSRSQTIESASRWLVGSSSSSVSAPENRIRASSTRRRWPPERVPDLLAEDAVVDAEAVRDLRRLRLRGVPAPGVQVGVGPLVAAHRPLPDRRRRRCPSPPRRHAAGVRRRRARARRGSARGRARRGRRCAGPAAGSRPSRWRAPVPDAGRPSPARILVRVVLPAPLRPTRPTLSPAATRKVTSCISSRAPARTSSCWAVIIRLVSLWAGSPASAERPVVTAAVPAEETGPCASTRRPGSTSRRVRDVGGSSGGGGGGGGMRIPHPRRHRPAAASAACWSSCCSWCSPSASAAAPAGSSSPTPA